MTPAPNPEPPAPSPALGAITVQIENVPAGVQPSVVLRSGSVERVVRQSRTVDSLPPGDYEVRAEPISAAGVMYDAEPATQVVNVRASQAAPRVSVSFRVRGATLVLAATGLPSYARGTVRVSGPGTFSRTALTGDTLRGLPGGNYLLVAEGLETTDGRFEAVPSNRSVTLPSNATQSVSFAYGPARASLTVTPTGLPAGALAGITVSGPGGFAERADTETTFAGLAAGLYTARAARVRSSGFSYDPDATVRDVSITGTQQRTLGFSYTLATGAIAVMAAGLPSGASANLLVTGPAGFSRALTGTQTLTDLEPGSYRVTAQAVTAQGVSYTPQPSSLDVVVTPSFVALPAQFQYSGSVGALAIEVLGLPPTMAANVKVTGPAGNVTWITGTETLENLAPGSYLVEAQTVSGTTDSWDPEISARTVSVKQKDTASAGVRYSPRTGALAVSVLGLPSGVSASVRVTGPGSFNRTLTETTTLQGLTPGTYTVAADPVVSGGTQYTASPATASVSVTRGNTATRTVGYGGVSTTLTVDFSGLPSGTLASATVTGPGGFTRTLTGPAVLENLAVGTYRISASRVTTSSAAYDPAPATIDVSLSAGQRRTESVAYAIASGSLAVSVAGLPSGTAAAITVSGPDGFSRALTGTQTLTMLAPGAYTVTAATVSTAGGTFAPTPSTRTVTVSASLVAAAAPVSYATAVGAVRVTMTGLPSATAGAATLVGPGTSQSLAQSTIVTGLAAGAWEVRGNTVTVNADRYAATPASRPITVLANDTIDAPISFARVTGHLALTISGLPQGTSAAVTVTGPDAFIRTVNGSQSLTGLEPGTYTVSAASITSGATEYTASTPSQTVSVTAGGNASASVAYTGQTTSLAISVSGVPSGSSAAVTVNGPSSFTRAVSSSTTLVDLAAGTYTIAASRIVSGSYGYSASPASQSVSLTAGDSKSAAVAYAVSTGALTVTVSGLPSGVSAPVTVTGPGSFSRTVSATQTLADLAPGTYTIAAGSTTSGATSYTPASTSQTVSVTAGATASRSVTYTGNGTSLAITVNGVPSGSTAAVTVTGPGGFSRVLTATTTLSDLAAGTYTVSAATISAGGYSYAPTPTSTGIALATGENKTHVVTYAATTGRLTLSIGGLPTGTNAAVTVTGPGSYSQAVTAGTTLSNLAPGTYTVAAANVTASSTLYTPSAASQTVSVTAGATASRSVTYSGSSTSLAVTISGVPGGSNAAVTVTGPSSFSRALTATTTLTDLAAGTYTVAGASISSGGYTWAATPSSQAVAIATGESKAATVTYAATTGRLTVSISGLPTGTNAAVTVTGPGSYSQAVTAGTTLSNLAPGTYTVAASNVSASGTTYAPSATSQTVSVTAGATASRTVTYAAQGSTGGGSGTNLTVEAAYVTQAIQTFTGTVPLVTNREALLRVFVKAAASNTLQPTVRVRLYEGTTNFRTFTINAPSGSVPTAIDEATLTSSWNATLSASDMRADLRIQVDVDPGNAVSEPDETDNVWPRSGTQALDVRAAAPFNVVFVPVHQPSTGLTGNVTSANLESQYLSLTRRIFPLNTINASVRATFTSNAAALQSGDGNSAWLTVLSEINSLRAADGSAANYYGVVGTSYSSGVAGYGYVPGRAAVGWDKAGSALRVTAHELGHNFGRRHVAACGSGNTDSNYPYSGGSIGHFGWNSANNSIVSPTSHTDIMGYCGTQWISDYTWTNVLNYRGTGSMVAEAFGAATQTSLLVWGRVQNGVVTLEPATRVVTRPLVADRPGRYRLELRDDTGRALTGFTFEPTDIDHNDDAQAFAFAVPIDAFTESRLASVAIVGGTTGTVVQTASTAMIEAMGGAPATLVTADDRITQVTDPRATVTPVGAATRVTWDDAAWPMALVRDAATGQVLTYLRASGNQFVPRGATVRITFTNGIRSLTREMPAR